MQIKKNKQAITRGVAILGIKMYSISFFIFSGGSGKNGKQILLKYIEITNQLFSAPHESHKVEIFYSLQG